MTNLKLTTDAIDALAEGRIDEQEAREWLQNECPNLPMAARFDPWGKWAEEPYLSAARRVREIARELRQQEQQPVAKPKPQMAQASCGHTCPAGSIMSTSNGTSCPDCYDSMSE